ncbi:hypothetical protein QYE76_065838 [Lolium multiflorum]|uniref:Uncharacterized protein n=1 Tax=Lolium multiflorum TaxID=4521 RepID=A0AAD8W991_LOLMU|nr:hypothetical protein QYE76_065838 [Lolium multiflorum]
MVGKGRNRNTRHEPMGKKNKKKKAPAAAGTSDAASKADEPTVESEAAASGDGIPPPSNGDQHTRASSTQAARGDQLPPDSAAAAKGKEIPPPPPSVEPAIGGDPIVDSGAAGSGDVIPPPVPTSVEPANGGEDAPPPPPSPEAANGDELPLDSAAAANEDGVLPPPPFPVEAPAPTGDKPPVDSAVEAKGDVIPPPTDSPAVEKAGNVGELKAERGLDDKAPEVTPDSSSSQPDRQAEKLQALNSVLVKEAVETRGQVAALAAQVDERSADAGALADLERHVLHAALIVPIMAAAEYGTALRGQLVDAQEPLQAAKSRAAREAGAREDAAARLEVAEAENLRFVELLGRKDAEAASAAKNVAGMEAVVSELAGNSTELCARKGDFEKQLGEMGASARSAHAQKAEVERSFDDYKMKAQMYQQEIQAKLDEKSKQLEALSSSKAEMEVKFQSLEAGLSAALANNWELESEVKTSMTELAEANRNLEKLRFEVADVGKKYTAMMAEADRLRKEMAKMMAIKDAAAAAFAAEKTQLHNELDRLNRKVESIRANKDAVMTSCRQKDAEAAKLKSQLNGLSDSLAEQRVRCDDLRAKSSRLQDELDTVKKALGEEKAQGDELRSTVGDLENYSAEKERKVVELKTEVQNKREQIYALIADVKKLQLAVADAEERGKSGKVWTWLCPTTTVIAAASFAYAARRRVFDLCFWTRRDWIMNFSSSSFGPQCTHALLCTLIPTTVNMVFQFFQ